MPHSKFPEEKLPIRTIEVEANKGVEERDVGVDARDESRHHAQFLSRQHQAYSYKARKNRENKRCKCLKIVSCLGKTNKNDLGDEASRQIRVHMLSAWLENVTILPEKNEDFPGTEEDC